MEIVIPMVNLRGSSVSEFDSLWNFLPSHLLSQCSGVTSSYLTSFKIAYSRQGLFVLVHCEDRILQCTGLHDFDDLFREDVVELFLWPDEQIPLYFELEISPLGAELPLLVANNGKSFMGWRPWHYEGERRIMKRIRIIGGEQSPKADVQGWQVELFIPFALFKGLPSSEVAPNISWRANLFRMDYDTGECAKWAWSPVTNGQFHNYWEFGTFRFG